MTRCHLTLSTYYNYPDTAYAPHAQTAMKDLGITYAAAHPFPIADCWRFFDCQNVPDVLPKWLTRCGLPDYLADAYGLERTAT